MLAQYRAVLSRPGALGFSLAAWIGRMWLSMTNLGILLLVTAETHRYGLAGAVSAVYVVTGALGQPYLGRLTDRLGQRRVLLPMLSIHAVGVVVLLLMAENGAPDWSLFLPAVPTGLCCPPLGSQVRARWSALLGGGHSLDTAYALESVLDEMVFVLGPVLVTFLSTSIDPAAGLLAALAFTVGGTLAFAFQGATEPEITPSDAGGPAPWRIPAIRTIAATYVMVGALFGSTDVTMIAFASQHGGRSYAGLLLALVSGGSAIGGLVYGSSQWRIAPERRFTLTVCSMALFAGGVAVAPTIPAMCVLGALMGVSIAPTLITSNLLVKKYCPPDRLTEGLSYIGSGLGVGFALGAPLAGRIVDSHSTHLGFGVGTTAAALAAVIALSSRGVFTAALTGPEHDERLPLTYAAES